MVSLYLFQHGEYDYYYCVAFEFSIIVLRIMHPSSPSYSFWLLQLNHSAFYLIDYRPLSSIALPTPPCPAQSFSASTSQVAPAQNFDLALGRFVDSKALFPPAIGSLL